MNPISVETQKKILFIPYMNMLILFIWLYNSFILDLPTIKFFRSSWIVFSSSLPLLVLQVIISLYFPSAGEFLAYLNAYLIPCVMGFRLINYQQSINKER